MGPFPLVLGLPILLSAGCASSPNSPSAPPSVDVTGTWAGTWSLGGAGTQTGSFTLRLQQTGSKVVGDRNFPGAANFSGPVEGTVSGNVFSYRQLVGSGGGEYTVTGNKMRGYGATGGQHELIRQE